MAGEFTYRELAINDKGRLIILETPDDEYLKVRMPIPIPRQSKTFEVFVLRRPRNLAQLSFDIYGTSSVWGLLAEWNALPDPASWLSRLLPAGYKARYLDLAKYKRFVMRLDRPTLNGVGDIEGED